ncbi:MAG: hypothetical protein VX727_08415 [Planctomycetota bacterium]|nr:hypothetical protein [Planctomycetota bacterium]
MGGFEIILIAVGIGWTIISGILKSIEDSKKKKALAAEAAGEPTAEPVDVSVSTASEEVTSVVSPRVEPSPPKATLEAGLKKLRDERIRQIRRRMGLEAEAAAQPAPSARPKPRPVPAVPRAMTVPAEEATPAPVTDAPRNASKATRPSGVAQGARERVLNLASTRNGLRDAVLLSELLSPPVALRQGHLD